jgi:signal transduction histidine kinase
MINFLYLRAITLFIVAFLNFILAIILWRGSKKDDSRKWLGFTALFSCFYAFFCGATYFFWGQDMETSLFWYKTTWLGILILPCFLVFTYYFTGNIKYIRIKALIIFLCAFVISYLVFETDLFVKSLRLDGYNISSIAGILDPFGRIYIFLCIILAIVNLIKYYFRANNYRRLQTKYFILGASIFAISGIISASIVPFIIGESPYYDIAAYISFIWIGLTSYAILKYNLMDIKVITAELLVFALWTIVFIKIFFSVSNNDLAINIIIFLVILFLGFMVVKSMLKELKQKEQVEKLAGDLKVAFETEKKAKEELETLDIAKDQFLLAIEHHLRTPLTAMLGYSDILLNGAVGKQPKKQKEITEKFQVSTKSLIKMVNDFLDVTQFQLGKEVITLKEGVDIVSIINEIISDLKFEIEKKKIYLNLEKTDEVFQISADREKLKAGLYNLVDNAVKYTNNGGVVVKIEKNNAKNILKIIIKDTGIGILPQNIPTLFGKTFERGSEAKKVFTTGRGIGVYIAGKIVKAHKGNIKVESLGEGKGSTFTIELPITQIV